MTFVQDRKIAYYASQVSDNIFETPEGYLICKNVPIARTGVQIYLGQELGINDKYDQEVKVYREEEDVFDVQAIASFEGKPFTDEHPGPEVDINNITQYAKGHVQNVRRSTEEPDLLIADIMAQDSQIISEIKNKIKRDISSGYNCYYVPYKDGYRQVEIRGNHIALVTKGRAGSRVSIKDNKLERKKRMAKKNIFAAMLKAFAKDADPDEVAEALDALNQKDNGEEKSKVLETPDEGKESKTEDDDPMAGMASRIDALEEKLNKLYSAEQKEGHEELIDENEELIDENDIEDEDMEEEKEEIKVSKDSLISLRSAVAKIRNPQDRKRASDALSKVFGRISSNSDVYSQIKNISIKSASKVKDSTPEEDKFYNLGKEIARKWNPHYKEEE